MARITTANFGGGGVRVVKADTQISSLEKRVLGGELTLDEANKIASEEFKSPLPSQNFSATSSTSNASNTSNASINSVSTPPSTRPYIWKYQ